MKVPRKLSILAIGLFLVVGMLTSFYFIPKNQSSETVKMAQTTQSNLVDRLTSATGSTIHVLNYSDLAIEKMADVYQLSTQEKIQEQLLQLIESQTATFTQPLIVSNPFLTNTTGLYLAFSTDEAVKISYRIDAQGYPSFEKNLKQNEEYATSHQYQIIGCIPNVDNLITLTATTQDGQQQQMQFHYTPPKLSTTSEMNYQLSKQESDESLSEGLFAVIGNQAGEKVTYLVDNDGYIRAEMPIVNYNSMRLVFNNQQEMFMAVSDSKIVKLNALGQVKQVLDLANTDYLLHHDYILNDKNQLIALATSKTAKKQAGYVEDRIITIDLSTQEVTEIANFEELLPDLYQKATGIEEHSNNKGYLDPVHINSLQLTDNQQLLVSSRETSTILVLKPDEQGIYQVEYMMGDEAIWQGVGECGQLLLEKEGSFTSQYGQHSITYETAEDLSAGQYYLSFFNNNSTIMDSRIDISLAKIADKTAGKTSKYMKYLVDEKTNSYKLVESFDVPYSAYVSSVQNYQNHIIVDSGQRATFAEYTNSGKLIQRFTQKTDTKYLYRVYKYDFKNYYFE
ncbi:aryl-sulfate sulfotransferase [Enterococcus cecorum]|uniref:Aryl-sulfate sulfotransferase n=1 Tax=Enterococcus cecorum TaxID=44008 RepID=A0AAW9JRH7_9ENTE|nr:aryl-sulfate sulfotransferase [Enterococcus cecorum]MDZ5439745.1 aryl-sulfate sulfotransferase [Enterococcus cecorum]MDZ5497807.1 aryl-sulfate sulfotransferase [Enterococcus cecorum]MDZ5499591.1 aryl-sulfate sulfotransferase [Enterococcus cecorum]MDZ5504687.1 aryl-sulfate sulfotransferase [Enterococcus cecorum]MDZ5532096.1 aryl-sulfate sulfotransferase [Enterococcus cecorum]